MPVLIAPLLLSRRPSATLCVCCPRSQEPVRITNSTEDLPVWSYSTRCHSRWGGSQGYSSPSFPDGGPPSRALGTLCSGGSSYITGRRRTPFSRALPLQRVQHKHRQWRFRDTLVPGVAGGKPRILMMSFFTLGGHVAERARIGTCLKFSASRPSSR